MNWLTKLVSFLSGEDEKVDEREYEKSDVKSNEDSNLNARNVLSSTPSLEGQNRTNPKAEARVAYQYPKGNFRFPIIPDEKLSNREERLRRTARTYVQKNPKEEVASSSSKRPKYQTKPKEKKDEPEKTKRPFHPTAIPSPVYGFQSRDERIMNRQQLSVEKEKSEPTHSLFSMTDEKKSSDQTVKTLQQEQVEKPNPTDLYFENSERQLAGDDHQNNVNYSNEEIVENGSKTTSTIERILEENDLQIDVDDEDSTSQIITVEENADEENDQFEDVHLSTYEQEGERNEAQESLELSFDNTVETAIEDFEGVESHHTDYPESELYNEHQLSFEDNTLDINHTVQQNKTETDLERVTDEEIIITAPAPETKSSIESQPVNHVQEEPKKEEKQYNRSKNTNNTIPFNVMMLGRDKQQMKARENSYQFPSLGCLNVPEKEVFEDNSWMDAQRELLDVTLKNFNVRASVVNVTQGPSVTRFEVHPEPGVKVNKITNLSDDIKLSLAAKDIRIEAPIPGKNTIGIEVPNKVSKMVYLREILRSQEFRTNPSPMTAVLGLDISGQPAVTDLKKMPHGLIAGATGSGKSVCINTILVSLLYKASPHEVKLMLIDPKMVELAPYNDIPHLVSPVITDVKAATAALKWAVEEMERRYELFAHSGTREITRYNQLVKEHKQGEHLPYLVIIIDELADLMMVAPSDVEEAICRIAQKARACGIHLIVATQRPSVDVITGLIKANIPTRIAFSVSSQVDSRTIIDVNGAEKLLGKGDMLFLENGSSKAVRLQGTFVSDEEIERVVKHVKLQLKPNYLFHQDELVKKASIQSEEDELFLEACEFVVNQGGASTSLLQRRFRIGYNRAARLIDMMEEQGIISENRGSKPRDILISEEELDTLQESSAY
jgi:S-DNA-T family DNA segregation ATPase FtsK/SpoIIIE